MDERFLLVFLDDLVILAVGMSLSGYEMKVHVHVDYMYMLIGERERANLVVSTSRFFLYIYVTGDVHTVMLYMCSNFACALTYDTQLPCQDVDYSRATVYREYTATVTSQRGAELTEAIRDGQERETHLFRRHGVQPTPPATEDDK